MKVNGFTGAGNRSFGLIENGGVIDVGRRPGRARAGLHDLLQRTAGVGPLRCLLPMPVLLRPAGIHDGKQ